MQTIKLNLIPGTVAPVCYASQNDVGLAIRFLLFDGETALTLSGTEVITLAIKKADGSELEESVTNTGSNYVDVITTADTCDTPGASLCELRFQDGGDDLGTGNFIMEVEADAYAGANIEERTTSGTIATFDTNLVEALTACKCTINPLQDLHGYTKPWSGGAGKNKLENTSTVSTLYGVTFSKNDDGSVKLTGTSTGSGTGTYITFFTLPSGTYIFTDGSTSTNYYMFVMVEGDGTWYKNGMSFTVDGNTRTRVVMYVANATATNTTLYPMIRLSSVADASFEPYENICPITGFSGANIVRCGVNLSIPLSDNTDLDASGNVISFSGRVGTNIPITLNSNSTKVVFNSKVGGTQFRYALYKNGVSQGRQGNYNSGQVIDTSNADSMYISFFAGSSLTISDITSLWVVDNNKYTTYAIPFGQTVYGGVLDVTNGKLTITHGIIVVDNTKNIIKNSVDNNNYLYWISTPLNNRYANQISNMLEYKAVSVIAENGTDKVGFSQTVRTSDTILYFNLGDLGITNDVASLKTWLENNPLTVVYELATPTEITLTEKEIEALLGTNNVYHDCNGEIEVKYLVEV